MEQCDDLDLEIAWFHYAFDAVGSGAEDCGGRSESVSSSSPSRYRSAFSMDKGERKDEEKYPMVSEGEAPVAKVAEVTEEEEENEEEVEVRLCIFGAGCENFTSHKDIQGRKSKPKLDYTNR